MWNRHRCGRLALSIALLVLGCANAASDGETPPEEATVRGCEEPRPEVCAQLYDPVCAERDNGVRCVTTPCDSTDPREYSNACEACRDPKVVSYVPGRC